MRGGHRLGDPSKFEEIKHNRRRFLGTAATTLAAAQFGMFRSAEAQSWTLKWSSFHSQSHR
jgi:hypothetical protein